MPAATCLTQALVTKLWLARTGHHATVRIGVARSDGGELQAHAWVENSGTVVIGGSESSLTTLSRHWRLRTGACGERNRWEFTVWMDGRSAVANLERMNSILAHRGPDGAVVWHNGVVGLGHRMLHTTPESLREVLPLVNRGADLVITADARIDNREELIASLDLKHRPAAELADSELILAAYEKWGDHSPEKLLGDFAFVIWDGRQRSLFCARDHFGVKPFYYFYRPGHLFAFASEIKGRCSAMPRFHANSTK